MAMTDAQRQAQRRAKLDAERAALERDCAELRQQVEDLKKTRPQAAQAHADPDEGFHPQHRFVNGRSDARSAQYRGARDSIHSSQPNADDFFNNLLDRNIRLRACRLLRLPRRPRSRPAA